MLYFIAFLSLLLIELTYFQIANRFNIIDRPNERSSHSSITLRGGGIIFYIAVLIYFFLSGFKYPFFFLGLTLMAAVSFLDDVFTLSNRIRLAVHFGSVMLLTYQLNIFEMPWYYLLITFIIAVGVINAYNFMDGINGITASYSLAVGALLMLVNREAAFIDQELLIYIMLGLLVFAWFNFRIKARCFAGDVGSVTIAFILLFALGSLILQVQNLIYMLFLAVYGIDSVWTIVRRLYLKENIFKAHRSHLFQFLANEAGVNKLLVSFIYGVLQFIIGLLVIRAAQWEKGDQILFAVGLLSGMSLFYLIFKTYIIRTYVKKDSVY